MHTRHWLEWAADQSLPLLLRQSADASLMVLLAGLILWAAGRRMPAPWRHGLWLLVFARLLLPDLPVVPIPDSVPQPSALAATTPAAAPRAPLAASPSIPVTAPSLPGVPPAASAPRTQTHGAVADSHAPVTAAAPVAVAPVSAGWWSWNLRQWLTAVWLMGLMGVVATGTWRSVAMLRRMHRQAVPANEQQEALLCQVASEFGWQRPPPLRVSSVIRVPALTGLWRPCIWLPADFGQLPPERLRLVLGHELGHWRRQDLVWQMLASAVLALHWFNPLLWYAHHRLREEAETACDEWLLRRLPQDQARSYADTLLDLVDRLPHRDSAGMFGSCGMLGMAASVPAVKRRVLAVAAWMQGRRARRRGGAAALILLLVLGFLRAAEPPAPIAATAGAAALAPWTGTLQVHVYDEATQSALAGAKLTLDSENKFKSEAVADAAGRATLQLPAARPVYASLRVRQAGHVPMVVHWSFEQSSFQMPAFLELPVAKAVTVGGLVKDAEGKPLANATVLLIMRGSSMAGASQEIFPDIWERRVTTGAAGRWTFDEAPPARSRFIVTVEHPEFIPRTEYPAGDGVASYYAGKSEITLTRGSAIAGTVVDDATGEPVKKARIVLGESASGSTTYPTYPADDQGRFTIGNAPRSNERRSGMPRLVATVFASGYAPLVLIWRLDELKQPVELRLTRGRPLKVRIVDEKGGPLAGVQAVADSWHGPVTGNRGLRVMDHRLTTDAEGRFTWPNAPLETVGWSIFGAKDYCEEHWLNITPGPEETVVRLTPVTRLKIEASDAATQQPLPDFRVVFAYVNDRGEGRYWNWWDASKLDGKNGALNFTSGQKLKPGTRHALRLSAPGYEPLYSPYLDSFGPAGVWKAALQKAAETRIKLLLPDGLPAAGVKVQWNNRGSERREVEDGSFAGSPEGPDGESGTCISGPDGTALVSPEGSDFHLIATHPAGWASLRHADVREGASLSLSPWAAMEVDMTGLPADLQLEVFLLPQILDCPVLQQTPMLFRHAEKGQPVRSGSLLPGTYRLQLKYSGIVTAPLLHRLMPGETWKVEAAKLWRWCQPVAEVVLSPGVKLAPEAQPLTVELNPPGSMERASTSNERGYMDKLEISAEKVTEIRPAAGGGWAAVIQPLGPGNYRLHGILKGWSGRTAATGGPYPVALIDQVFTIPEEAVGPATIKREPKNEMYLRISLTGMPEFKLPAVRIEPLNY